jgi:hypothetical protein
MHANIKGGGLLLTDYSDKSLVITGTTRETGRKIADFAKKNNLWAKFNTALRIGENRVSGWVVGKKDETKWREFVLTIDDDAVSADSAPRREAAPKKRGEKGERSLSLNQAIYIRHIHLDYLTDKWNGRQYHSISYYKHGKDIIVKADYTDRRFGADNLEKGNTNYVVIPQNGAPTTIWEKDVKKMLEEAQPYTPPDFIYLTPKELQPAYNYDENVRLQKHILAREVMLGKLLVQKYREFDSMKDMHVYFEGNEYSIWTGKLPYDFTTDYKPYLSNGIITWGNYRLKPNPRKPKKKFYLFAEQQEQAAAAPVAKQEDAAKIAESLRKKAEILEKQAENRTSGGVFSQNWTPRRQRIMSAMLKDAEIMQSRAKTLRVLANMWQNGSVPDFMRNFRDISDFEIMNMSASDFNENGKKRSEKLGIKTAAQLEQVQRFIKDIQESMKTPENLIEKELREIELKQRASTEFDFFPTPESIANRMILEADIQRGERILEPSAGLGHIAKLIREQYPDNNLDVIEITSDRRRYLQLLGFNVLETNNFLNLIPSKENQYDKIIMNPPYSKKQAFKHVVHAYRLLAPGGRIVALMPATTENRDSEFDNIMNLYGKRSERIDNAFKGKESFHQTGVATVIVTIDKPFESKKEPLYITNDGRIGTIGENKKDRVELLNANKQLIGYYHMWQLIHFANDRVEDYPLKSNAILLAMAKARGWDIKKRLQYKGALDGLDGLTKQDLKTYKSIIQDFVDEIAKNKTLYRIVFGDLKRAAFFGDSEVEILRTIIDYLADKYKSESVSITPVNNANNVRIAFQNARYTFDVQETLPKVAESLGIKKPMPNFGHTANLSNETKKYLQVLKKYTKRNDITFMSAVQTIPGGHFATNGQLAVFIADTNAKDYVSDFEIGEDVKKNLFKILIKDNRYIGSLLNLNQLERFSGMPRTDEKVKDDMRILISGYTVYTSNSALKNFLRSIKEIIYMRAGKRPIYLYVGSDRIIASTAPPNLDIFDALSSKKYDFAVVTTAKVKEESDFDCIAYDTLDESITTINSNVFDKIYASQFKISSKKLKHAVGKLAAIKSGLGLRIK